MKIARSALILLVVSSWGLRVEARETRAPSGASVKSPSSALERAQAAYDEGLVAAEAGDFARALASFEESQALDPAPGTTLNLGRCKENLGRYADALADFEAVVSALPADDERATYARGRLLALEERVARVTLSLSPHAHGARVSIDGVELSPRAISPALPLDPGQHEVSVTAPGRDREVIEVTLRAGERRIIELRGGIERPPSVPTAPAPTPSRASTGSSTQRLLGFGALGLGVAGLATSAVTGLLAIDRKKTMDANCDGAECHPDGLEAAESGERMATISTAAFGAGLVFLGAGGALLYFDGPNEKRIGVQPRGDGATLFVGGAL